MTLTIATDRRLIRAEAKSTRYVLARVTAPRAGGYRLPVNVGLVLDRSGSMGDAHKFPLAYEAVEQALRMLQSSDRFSLVVYDSEIDVLARSTLATPEAKRSALSALSEIGPRGGTNLGGGWMKGCEQIAEFQERERVSRCLLLTDGLANEGITDREVLARHAGELRRRGVSTSTFGVGADFDERLLRDMAHEGGGNFYFIEGASQIPVLLTSELGEALEITMRQVSLVVTAPRGGTVEPLNRFRHQQLHDRNELCVELGDLTSGQELDVVLRMTFAHGEVGERARVGVAVQNAEAEVVWTYASHAENDAQPRNTEVDRAVAAIFAARARAEATEANRDGDFERARRVVERTAKRIRGYAGRDGELLRMAQALEGEAEQFDAPMSAMASKRSFYLAESAMMARDSSGRARR